ncbi:MAG: formylglycine-generating enzyme family protein [Planctomycetes bacterium]|nr:formylglycine-generating enzyme family protein [Planctomycetota bacterium]
MSVPLAELGAVVECLAAMGAEEELAELLERELRRPDKGRLEEEFAEWRRAPPEGEPPYEFVMGSPEEEEGRSPREARVRVVLTQSLWVRPVSVTYGQWLLMAENPDHLKSWGSEARLPATHVSWFEASLYARWVEHWRRRYGLRLGGAPAEYRVSLPSEAQREFFTRAGTTTQFWSGDSDADLRAVGWFGANSGVRVHAVGELSPNAWGVHDVHGNVLEWCRDWYADELRGGEDPLGPLGGRVRVLRGGSYGDAAWWCRSAVRYWVAPDSAWGNFGFRLVLSAPERSSKLGHWE